MLTKQNKLGMYGLSFSLYVLKPFNIPATTPTTFIRLIRDILIKLVIFLLHTRRRETDTIESTLQNSEMCIRIANSQSKSNKYLTSSKNKNKLKQTK